MGCALYKVQNQTESIVKTVTLSTRITKNIQTSQMNENKPEETCLKIRICEYIDVEWEQIYLRVSQLAPGMGNDCKKIYLTCNEFLSTLAYFEKIVHGVCVEKFSLVRGVEMVMIFANLHQIKVSLRKSKHFAYFDGKAVDRYEVFQVWNRIGKLIERFLEKKELEKEYAGIKDFLGEKCFWGGENVFETLNEYLKLYKETIKLVNENSEGIHEYMTELKYNIRKVEQKIRVFNLVSGSNFVAIAHSIHFHSI